MSYSHRKTFLDKVRLVRSYKSFVFYFLLGNMAGQKALLCNNKLPRVINLSFNEKTCVYSCKMCSYAQPEVRSMYQSGSEMEFSTLRRLVDCVPNDGYYSFDISAVGETLEFGPLPEFIAYMKREKPLVSTIISTNALLLTEKLARKLVASGLDRIQLSLFAENAADYKYITGRDAYEKVKANILGLEAVKRAMGRRKPLSQVFMLHAKETDAKAKDFLKFWSGKADAAFLRPISMRDCAIKGLTPMYQMKGMDKRYPCVVPWYSTALRSNGDVVGCAMPFIGTRKAGGRWFSEISISKPSKRSGAARRWSASDRPIWPINWMITAYVAAVTVGTTSRIFGRGLPRVSRLPASGRGISCAHRPLPGRLGRRGVLYGRAA